MGDEFYSSIKLVTGEEIFALVSTDELNDRTILILQNPVVMKIMNSPHGTVVKMKPWMQVPNDDLYIINYDKVVTMTEVTDEQVITIYNNYIEEEDFESKSDGHQTRLTEDMGYVSSVEETRKKLEELYNRNAKDSKES